MSLSDFGTSYMYVRTDNGSESATKERVRESLRLRDSASETKACTLPETMT
ncbi:hypothetical protein X777_14022 [Ooceraea biroi]|uniref:Uncharacterized protein n=1 Tax=Ooceraea biroi TaxID=2015173 RepID=A0A026WYE7_OOCBI|nr:hypothetical protein X777_14022 [Ooceraea biroi]